jgi:hypothetical protein
MGSIVLRNTNRKRTVKKKPHESQQKAKETVKKITKTER